MYIFNLKTPYQRSSLFFLGAVNRKQLQKAFFWKAQCRRSFIIFFTFMLSMALFTAGTDAMAQEVSITVKNELFTRVLTQIKEQTGYDFVIASQAKVGAIRVTLNVKKKPLEQVVQTLCDGHNLSFRISNKTIFINDKKELKAVPTKAAISLASQEGLRGRVLNEKGSALNGASLFILDDNESIVYKQVVSDNQGQFELPMAYKGMPLLVTYIGYIPYRIRAESTMADIRLASIPIDVEEILVTGEKPLVKRTIDKLILNIDGTIYENGENALTLLNAIPGVNVLGKDIIFRGAEQVTVYIDNRKIMIPHEQLTAYLQGIPSESILSYELKAVPGAENDAQNAGAIINIVMKSEYKYGLTGNINAGYWNNGEHNVNAGSFLNYRTGKTTFQGVFHYRNAPAFYEDHILQQFNAKDLVIEQDEKYLEKLNTYSVTVGLDHKLSDKQTIGANYNIFTNPRDFSNTTKTSTTFRSGAMSAIDSSSFGLKNDHYRYVSQMANIFYRNKLDTLGSVFDVGYSLVSYAYNNPTDLETIFSAGHGAVKVPNDSIYTYNDGRSWAHVFNIDLEKNFNKNWSTSIGAKYTTAKTDYVMEYRKGLDRTAPLDVDRSDSFVYNENILAFYATSNHTIDTWEFKLGLRTEQTHYNGFSRLTQQEIRKSRWDFFPSVYVSKEIADAQSLTLSYGRRINRPGFRQLNPFTYYTNINNIQEGNPFLLPYYSNNLQLEYLLRSKYSFTVGYQDTKNAIATKLTNIGDVTVSRDENNSDYSNIFLSAYVPIKITRWWNLNVNATLRHSNVDVNIERPLHRDKFSQNVFVMNRFTLPNKLFVEISGLYNRNTFYDYYDAKDIAKMDITIRRTFLKDKLSARMEICDPFHFYKPGQTFTTDHFSRVVTRNKIDFARYIGLWLTYNFSSGKKATNRENIDVGGNEVRGRL